MLNKSHPRTARARCRRHLGENPYTARIQRVVPPREWWAPPPLLVMRNFRALRTYLPGVTLVCRWSMWVAVLLAGSGVGLSPAIVAAGDGSQGATAERRAPEPSGGSGASTDVVRTGFEGRQTVRYDEFIAALRATADGLATHPNVRDAHAALLEQHALSDAELPLESFSRVRLVFEATRDGGLWDLRWGITDQMPWSDQIWKQWEQRAGELEGFKDQSDGGVGPSAIAECDELSALFALLSRDLGITGFAALHWPVWNHVVAVWQVPRADGGKARIVVPTSQVFLSRGATLGTTELATRRVLFPYSRHDLRPDSEMRGALARFLIGRARALGGLSTDELSRRRIRLGGS